MIGSDVIHQYRKDGCVRVHEFLSANDLVHVRRQLDRYLREIAPTVPKSDRVYEADGKTFRNLWRIEHHEPFFLQLGRQPQILSLVRELVHGEPVLMAVESFNKPARVGSGVPPHQDNAYFCQSPPDVLTIWIAMDAATESNGPIFYLKGSHRGGMQAHRPSGVAGNSIGLVKMPPHEESDVVRGILEPGDALVHHCETIHWSARNQTDHPRRGLLMVYRGKHTQHDPKLKEAYDAARALAPATAS